WRLVISASGGVLSMPARAAVSDAVSSSNEKFSVNCMMPPEVVAVDWPWCGKSRDPPSRLRATGIDGVINRDDEADLAFASRIDGGLRPSTRFLRWYPLRLAPAARITRRPRHRSPVP